MYKTVTVREAKLLDAGTGGDRKAMTEGVNSGSEDQ